ncbi:MAG: glutamate formimidoyltransferase [Chloroflexi bacterium]|nr:glutamate formimidoyltransferase [Chloroflexota bacterium]MCC6893466.1 glutamate formimidoyltransferase [Anaerolineae bacterium]
MKSKLVECIPNFSEGRRPEVINAIVDAVRSHVGVLLLDYSSDADHNRSVVTFAGEPSAVVEAAFSAIKAASELIDLDTHNGTHPRLGAADVVPFVPLDNMTLDECVQLAQQLGERVGSELDIPVYLYEAASTRPEYTRLESVRRGGYEALKDAITTDPERVPDYGPKRVGRAGATIIGARHPLVAFNVYLGTDDVALARRIARLIRASSGGFLHVKALGMLVDGRAQVSMNFTNPAETPLFPVIEVIRREAERANTSVHHSELIGLIPQSVLLDVAARYLQLENFRVEQVLEYRLSDVLKQKSILE